jgi:hypothetical protein
MQNAEKCWKSTLQQSVENLAEQSTQVKEKVTQLEKVFHELQLAIQNVN